MTPHTSSVLITAVSRDGGIAITMMIVGMAAMRGTVHLGTVQRVSGRAAMASVSASSKR